MALGSMLTLRLRPGETIANWDAKVKAAGKVLDLVLAVSQPHQTTKCSPLFSIQAQPLAAK
jgi:hypothetical protein